MFSASSQIGAYPLATPEDVPEADRISSLITQWEAAIDRLDAAPDDDPEDAQADAPADATVTAPAAAARVLAAPSADQSFAGTEPCDPLLPALAQAAANARAAGLSLFAPAGDDGLCGQLPWPACLANVAAVGAVYAAGEGFVRWCVDSSSCAEKTPDESCDSGYAAVELASADWVPAYSNSNGQLTFLARADPTLTDELAGTELAALAAAHATANLQTAARTSTGRYLMPGEIRAIFALSGQPITDSKTEITTPRIDLAHAFEMLPDADAEPLETSSSGTNSMQRWIIQPGGALQAPGRQALDGAAPPDASIALDPDATTTECDYDDSLWVRSRNLTGVANYLSCRAMTLGPRVAVLGGAKIKFQAGELIRLQPGFRVQTGARVDFRVKTTMNDDNDDSYDYASECPASGGPGRIDSWSFYRCECTSYVADKLNEVGLRGGDTFNNCYRFSGANGEPACRDENRWGDASRWRNVASRLDIPCNDQPRRGAVAWFASGHVAFVEAVNEDANSVDITEYNYATAHEFGTRTLTRGNNDYPDCFIQVPLAETGPPINDTGIDWCADADTNFLDCRLVGSYAGQDGGDGRDVTHSDHRDGHAGFSFTKLDANGYNLPASATNWSCVRDNVTGLVWEVKTNAGGLHDRDDRYNWYSTDASNNGGFAGYADDDGAICSGYNSSNPSTYCNTQAYVARVNAQGLCGARDWRLPSVDELLSIVSNDRYGPAIDTDYFPNAVSSAFWSSSPDASEMAYAWIVYFLHGSIGYDGKRNGEHVRLVRTGQ